MLLLFTPCRYVEIIPAPSPILVTTCILILKFKNKGVFVEEIHKFVFSNKKEYIVIFHSPPSILRKRGLNWMSITTFKTVGEEANTIVLCLSLLIG